MDFVEGISKTVEKIVLVNVTYVSKVLGKSVRCFIKRLFRNKKKANKQTKKPGHPPHSPPPDRQRKKVCAQKKNWLAGYETECRMD